MKINNKKIAASPSSAAWLTRQARDPYVARAQREGYRARAVYKLIEINEKFKFLKNGQVIVDLGAAPGSWSQYIAREFPRSRVIAMDLLHIKPIPGVTFYTGDFTTDEALDWLNKTINNCPPTGPQNREPTPPKGGVVKCSLDSEQVSAELLPPWGESQSASPVSARRDAVGGQVDVVLSDMAPNTTGHQKTDHLRQMTLLEYAWDFAKQSLKPGGTFVAKSFTGGTTSELLADMKKSFEKVAHVKPAASRKDSVEMFIVGLRFKNDRSER
ncbi:MAG: RlmE family RNA methyltransferase [Proteobacteria bacterium]|nr:RlmE family RNA methyltransferase [Pseudomonadota bacterium]